MIPWRKYDPTDRGIESHVDHLVTNGRKTLVAQHASIPGKGKYCWRINNTLIPWVTHWSPINKPEREDTE